MIELLLWSALTVFSELAIVRMFCTLVGGTSYFGNLFLLMATFVAACGLMAPFLARHARWIGWTLLLPLLVAIWMGQFNLAEFMPGEFFWSAVARVKLRPANFDLWLGVMLLMVSSIGTMLLCGAVQGSLIKSQAQGGKAYLLLAVGGLLGGLLFALQNQLVPQLISLLLVWSGLVGACLAYRLRGQARSALLVAVAPLAVMLVVGGIVSSQSRWSPYHRVDLMAAEGGYSIMVNGFYICSVSTVPYDKLTGRASSANAWTFKSMRPGDRVLVVGSGAGTADVREALHYGASEVTAAEIEPAFIRIGNEYDPDKTYQNPKVNLVNTDGRKFLSSTDKQFDFVFYPFVDSHATASNRARFRLDSFLYTVDGMRLAYSRVAPGGVLAVSFATFTPWIGQRMYDILRQATGEQVRVFHRDGNVWMIYMVSKGRPIADMSAFFKENTGMRPSALEVPSDDWPFFYSLGREIPSEYLRIAAMVMMLFLTLFSTIESLTRGEALRSGERVLAGTVRPGLLFYAFFSGAAFFFIELRTISALSPVFGSTYLSQSLSIIGIIACSLGGALVASRWPLLRARWVWMALFVLVAASGRAPEWFHPHWGSVLRSSPVLLLALLLPVFCAGYLYFLYVRELEPSAVAAMTKWNLIGGAVGGLTESSIILLGFELSVWVAALFYFVALIGVGLARERERSAPHQAGAREPTTAPAAAPGE